MKSKIIAVLLSAMTAGMMFQTVPVNAEDPQYVEITQSQWNPESAKNLSPLSSFTDSPTLTSRADGKSEAYIQVDIPVIRGAYGNDEISDALTIWDLNSRDFSLEKKTVATQEGKKSTYLYKYREKLDKNVSTSPLCTGFSVPDFTSAKPFTGTVDITGIIKAEDGKTYKEKKKLGESTPKKKNKAHRKKKRRASRKNPAPAKRTRKAKREPKRTISKIIAKTWDSTSARGFIIAFAGSLILLALILDGRRKSQKDKNDSKEGKGADR